MGIPLVINFFGLLRFVAFKTITETFLEPLWYLNDRDSSPLSLSSIVTGEFVWKKMMNTVKRYQTWNSSKYFGNGKIQTKCTGKRLNLLTFFTSILSCVLFSSDAWLASGIKYKIIQEELILDNSPCSNFSSENYFYVDLMDISLFPSDSLDKSSIGLFGSRAEAR